MNVTISGSSYQRSHTILVFLRLAHFIYVVSTLGELSGSSLTPRSLLSGTGGKHGFIGDVDLVMFIEIYTILSVDFLGCKLTENSQFTHNRGKTRNIFIYSERIVWK